MQAMIKCPVCNKLVPEENEYCVYCGVRMKAEPEPATPAKPAPDACAGPKYCPNGHTVSNPGLGFCSVCGKLLVDKPVPVPKAETVPHSFIDPAPSPVRRCCRNGHSFDDPELQYCPECAQPLMDAPAVREVVPVSRETSGEEGYGKIPLGLRFATEDDLRPN